MTSLFTPALSRVWEALSVLRGEVSTKPSQTQGRITSVNPVRVQLDTDSSPSPLTPRVLNGPVAVGDRVTVLHTKHDLTVIGVVGKKPVAGHRYAVRSQTIPAETVTTLGIFGSAGDDVSGGVTTVSNYGLRVPEDGWYSLSGMLRWAGTSPSTQLRLMDFTHSNMLGNDSTRPADAGGEMSHVSVAAIRLPADTVIGLSVYTTAQRATNTADSFNMACHLSLAKIG